MSLDPKTNRQEREVEKAKQQQDPPLNPPFPHLGSRSIRSSFHSNLNRCRSKRGAVIDEIRNRWQKRAQRNRGGCMANHIEHHNGPFFRAHQQAP